MSSIIDSCPHYSEILDSNSGDYICSDCGLVLGRYYCHNKNQQSDIDDADSTSDFVKEVIERLNLPQYIAKKVLNRIKLANLKKSQDICCVIYEMLIELGLPYTLKEITSVTGVPSKEIKMNNTLTAVAIVEEKEILERCCSKLGLTFKDYTLIKNSIASTEGGFNPSTVIAAHIFNYCKLKRKDIKLKNITSVVGISAMSVHRYLKKNVVS